MADVVDMNRSARTRARNESGFTLFELLAALVIMGTAVSIFLGLFSASLDLADHARFERAAASLAEEFMTDIQRNPEAYNWPDYATLTPGELVSIQRKDQPGEMHKVEDLPLAMPTTKRAYNRERNFYYGFYWKAFARVPNAGDNFVEIVVEVEWSREGRRRLFALTSALPRSLSEGLV